MEKITELNPIIVAIIALIGVIYSAHHSSKFDDIKSLTESLVNLKKSGREDSDKVKNSIEAIAGRLDTETKNIKPLPRFLGIILVSVGIIGLAVSSFIPSDVCGIVIFFGSVAVSCFGIWMIPRCK
jgi:hypothetical protein